MRQNQIASSQGFNGIVDQNDPDATKITNISGPSAGVNGDGVKLAGTRVSLDDLKKLGNVTVRSDGIRT